MDFYSYDYGTDADGNRGMRLWDVNYTDEDIKEYLVDNFDGSIEFDDIQTISIINPYTGGEFEIEGIKYSEYLTKKEYFELLK